jgi:hypothetical protein
MVHTSSGGSLSTPNRGLRLSLSPRPIRDPIPPPNDTKPSLAKTELLRLRQRQEEERRRPFFIKLINRLKLLVFQIRISLASSMVDWWENILLLSGFVWLLALVIKACFNQQVWAYLEGNYQTVVDHISTIIKPFWN